MSKYTTEVRYICEVNSERTEGSVADYIKDSWKKIFNFDFPIWDEDYRQVLCTKILKHYYTREIGFETVGLWRLKLETKMNEIMPYYNDLYYSTTLKYNPLFDADYYRTTTGKDEGENNRAGQSNTVNTNTDTGSFEEDGSATGRNKKVNKFSDTPQGGLVGVENDEYLTNATIDENEGSNTNHREGHNVSTSNGNVTGSQSETGNFTTTKDYVEHVAGKFPGRSYAKNIREYRDNLINIDVRIIDELSDLFMLVW